MSRLTLIVAVWSFVVAPALCRAGALAACCTHEPAPSAPVACCPSHETSPADPPADSGTPPRKCGSCADVCKGVTKPDEHRDLAALGEQLAQCSSPPLDVLMTVCAVLRRPAHDCLIFGPDLPYPASDLPLRI